MKNEVLVPLAIDQRVDLKFDQRLAKSHFLGFYLALKVGQCKICCPAKAFDPPMQSVTLNYTLCNEQSQLLLVNLQNVSMFC